MTTRHLPGLTAIAPALGLAILLASAPSATPVAVQQPDLSVKAVVAAARRYVAEYQRQFAFLVADETYTQTRLSMPAGTSGRRTMRGELFLTYLAADAEWIAVHDFAEVDGEPVADREDIRQLLSKGAELRGIVGRVADRNARFNIGAVERNFNEPTLALHLLDAKHVDNVRFERTATTTDAGATVVTLAFRERGRPTLVRGPSGPIRAQGEFTIDAATGWVQRTFFELADGPVVARLTTGYGLDQRLALWVPMIFTERYESTRDDRREIVTGEARYTNYRRFTVTGRIR